MKIEYLNVHFRLTVSPLAGRVNFIYLFIMYNETGHEFNNLASFMLFKP